MMFRLNVFVGVCLLTFYVCSTTATPSKYFMFKGTFNIGSSL